MSFYPCRGGVGVTPLILTNINASGNIGKNGDGACGASSTSNLALNVESFKKVTVGTVNCTQSNTYSNSTAQYSLDSEGRKSFSSKAVIDISKVKMFYIYLSPSIYGNAGDNRSGSVSISSLTFE